MAIKKSEIYRSIMIEIKIRIRDTNKKLSYINKNNSPSHFEIESSFLNIRKIIELICFSSVLCDENRYKEQRNRKNNGDYTKDWNAKLILEQLKLISPHFMPIPLKGFSIISEKKHFERKDINIATHNKLIKMYKKCGSFMHIMNPFVENYEDYILANTKKYYDAVKIIELYVNDLKELLWEHAAVRLSFDLKDNPTLNSNPKSAWIINFGDPSHDNISMLIAEAI